MQAVDAPKNYTTNPWPSPTSVQETSSWREKKTSILKKKKKTLKI